MNLYFCPVFTHTIRPAKAKCGKHFVLYLNVHKLFMHKTIQKHTHVWEIYLQCYMGVVLLNLIFSAAYLFLISAYIDEIIFIGKHQNEWCPSVQGIFKKHIHINQIIKHQYKYPALIDKIWSLICVALQILSSLTRSVILDMHGIYTLNINFIWFLFFSWEQRRTEYNTAHIYKDEIIHILLNATSNMNDMSTVSFQDVVRHPSKEMSYPIQKWLKIFCDKYHLINVFMC